MALVTASFVDDILTGFCCCVAVIRTNNHINTASSQGWFVFNNSEHFYCIRKGKFSPSLPASCSWIFSISIGVVITTWHMPAPHPANISLNTVRFFLLTDRQLCWTKRWLIYLPLPKCDSCSYPSFASRCLKKSFAANLIAFSGVTKVKFTAAPEEKKKKVLAMKSQ